MTNPLLEQFIAEAGDLLADVDDGLLQLERSPEDSELVNAIFRAAHTFKGSSGLFDLPDLTRLTHAAEDLLDAVRGGSLSLDGTMVDDLLAAFDAVRGWIPVISATGVQPAGAATIADQLTVRLRAPLGGSPAQATAAPVADAPAVPAVAPAWLRDLPETTLSEVASWLDITGGTIRALHYRPDSDCFFRGEDPVNLVRQVPAIESLTITAPDDLPGIAELDEYDCVLRFTALTRASTAEISHIFRYVTDQVEVTEVSGSGLTRLLAGEPEAQAAAAVDGASVAVSSTVVALLRAQTRVLEGATTATGVRAAAGVVLNVVGDATLPVDVELLKSVEAAAQQSLSTGDGAAVSGKLELLLGALGGGREAAGVHLPAEVAAAPVAPVAPPADAPVAEAEADGDAKGSANRVLKVEQAKVDRLLDLVGELVVAKNGLPFVAAAAEEAGDRATARRIKDEFAVISRVSEELQQAVMDVRMLPIATAFIRAPRLVRDLSRKLGKQVRLVQDGEDNTADKDVIEALAEPLVHLVRNSLDHGIETPEDRVAAGKPAEATLTLRAVPDGDAIVVEIVDDGRGIDTDAVRRRAYERGLIDELQLERMPDAEAAELIFAPGFSTAQQISDVSGRGVGMDAVRTTIERLGGSVAVDSRFGEGLTVRLRLPLTMAISRVLLFTAGGQRFGVPIDDVLETVSVAQDDITHVAGREVLVLREDVVPLVPLSGLLDLPPVPPASMRNVVVVRTATGPLGIVIDRFHQNTDVILKPLDGLLAGTPGYCGTALLGDGLVLLVLDVKELNNRAIATR